MESIRVFLSATSIGSPVTRSFTSSTDPCLATSIWLSTILASTLACLTVALLLLLNRISLHHWLFTKHATLLCGTIGNNRRLRYVDILTLIRLSLSFLYHANRTRLITEAIAHHFYRKVLILVLIIYVHLVNGALLRTNAVIGLDLIIAILNVVDWSIVWAVDLAGLSCGCITKLRLILFVLLLDWGRMWIHARSVGLVLLVLVLLGDVDLTTISGWNDVLSCSFAVLHIGDLRRSMTTSLSHSLYRSNDLLILAIFVIWNQALILRFNSSFVLIDLQLKHTSFIGSCSATIWAPVNALTSFIVYRSFAGRLVGHLWLCTLGRINSAGYRPLWGILITDLQLLETVIKIRILTVLDALCLEIFLKQFFATIRLTMTIRAIRCILAVLDIFVLRVLIIRLRLLLNLRMEFSKLYAIRILALELLIHLIELLDLMLKLVFLLD